MLRLVTSVVGGLLLLPVCLLVGLLVAMPLAYGYSDVEDPTNSAAAVAGLVRLQDGSTYCREIPLHDVDAYRESLGVRLAASRDELETCKRDFGEYTEAGGWRVALGTNERRIPGVSFEVESRNRLVVTRFLGDARASATRYQVGDGGEAVNVEMKGASPGRGVVVVIYGGSGGLLVWAAFVAFLARRALVGRRRLSEPVTSSERAT